MAYTDSNRWSTFIDDTKPHVEPVKVRNKLLTTYSQFVRSALVLLPLYPSDKTVSIYITFLITYKARHHLLLADCYR